MHHLYYDHEVPEIAFVNILLQLWTWPSASSSTLIAVWLYLTLSRLNTSSNLSKLQQQQQDTPAVLCYCWLPHCEARQTYIITTICMCPCRQVSDSQGTAAGGRPCRQWPQLAWHLSYRCATFERCTAYL